jgi:putative membrane protein
MPQSLAELSRLIPPAVVVFLIFVFIGQFIRQYRGPAKKLSAELTTCADSISRIRELAPHVRRVSAGEVLSKGSFAHHWAEFQHTLHDQYRDEDGERVIRQSRATAPASYYFSPQSVVDTPLRTEYFRHLPGILTGIGIIGTFFGLIMGLSGFDPGTPEKVQESVNGLIRDVFFAFIGSLVAIVGAMIVTHLEKHWLRVCYERLEKLTDAIDQLFDAGVGEEYLADLVHSSQESSTQTRNLAHTMISEMRVLLTNIVDTQVRESLKLAETLTGSYKDSGDRMAAQISQSIESSFRAPLERIADSVSAVSGDQSQMVGNMLQDVLLAFMTKLEGTFGQQFQGLSAMLEQSVSSMQQMQSGFAALVGDMRSASEASTQTMSEQLAKTMHDLHGGQEAMQTSMNQMVQTLQVAVESMGTQGVEAGTKIASQLERMYADGEARQQKMADQMDGFVQQMQDSVGRGQRETIEQIAGTVRQLDGQMQTMVEGMGQSLARAQESGLESVSAASAALGARLDEMFGTFEKRRQDMDEHAQSALQRFQQEAHTALSGLGDQVRTLIDLVERERQSMRGTLDALSGQTERSIQGMQVGADKMRTAAERFDDAGGSVHDMLHSSADTVSGLRSGSSEIAVAVRELSTIVADYRQSRDVTTQNIGVLQSIIESAQREATLRQKAVEDLDRLSVKIHAAYAETEEYLGQVPEVLGKGFTSFTEGVQDSLSKTMRKLDTDLSNALGSLTAGVDQIGERLEELSGTPPAARHARA